MTPDPFFMPRSDYDAIAHLYDEPLRDHSLDPFLEAFAANQSVPGPARPLVIADLGCGTGKWLAANAVVVPGARLIGLDRSRGMLQVARRRLPGVPLLQADWACLPLADRSADFLRSTFSYHFVPDKPAMLREAHRALRPRGRLAITDIDPWAMEGWAIYRFFPEARALDEADFLHAEALGALMREVGFEDVEVTRHASPATQDLREFLAYAGQRHRASQMRAISDEAYAHGLQAIRDAIRDALARAPNAPPVITSEFCLAHVTGSKPVDA